MAWTEAVTASSLLQQTSGRQPLSGGNVVWHLQKVTDCKNQARQMIVYYNLSQGIPTFRRRLEELVRRASFGVGSVLFYKIFSVSIIVIPYSFANASLNGAAIFSVTGAMTPVSGI